MGIEPAKVAEMKKSGELVPGKERQQWKKRIMGVLKKEGKYLTPSEIKAILKVDNVIYGHLSYLARSGDLDRQYMNGGKKPIYGIPVTNEK